MEGKVRRGRAQEKMKNDNEEEEMEARRGKETVGGKREKMEREMK